MMEKYISPHTLPTPYQREIATILIEECAELTKDLTKLLRFGADDGYPNSTTTNTMAASYEAGNVMAMILKAAEAEILNEEYLDKGMEDKLTKLDTWLQHAPEDTE